MQDRLKQYRNIFNKTCSINEHISQLTRASVIVVIIDRTQFFGKANNQFQSNLHLQVLMQTQFLEYLGLQHHVGTIVMWHRYYAKLKIDPEYLKRVTFLQDYLHRSNLSKISPYSQWNTKIYSNQRKTNEAYTRTDPQFLSTAATILQRQFTRCK